MILIARPGDHARAFKVGYKDESKVFKCRVEKSNAIVNALNRTKREEHPDLAALQEDRAKEYRRYVFITLVHFFLCFRSPFSFFILFCFFFFLFSFFAM